MTTSKRLLKATKRRTNAKWDVLFRFLIFLPRRLLGVDGFRS